MNVWQNYLAATPGLGSQTTGFGGSMNPNMPRISPELMLRLTQDLTTRRQRKQQLAQMGMNAPTAAMRTQAGQPQPLAMPLAPPTLTAPGQSFTQYMQAATGGRNPQPMPMPQARVGAAGRPIF